MSGIDHLNIPAAHLEEHKDIREWRDRFEAGQTLTVQNKTIVSTVGAITYIVSPTEPSIPDTPSVWFQTREGAATVIRAAAQKSDGNKTWLWMGETP